jgi:AmpE protein
MTFLAMVFAVGLFYIWGAGGPLQRDDWFDAWQQRVAGSGLLPGIALALLILLPVLLVVWLLALFDSWLFGLPWLAAAVALMLYAFGRADYHTLVEEYANHCQTNDMESAWLAVGEQVTGHQGEVAPESAAQMHRQVSRALVYEGYQRWFPVLFYFLLLGPAGALAYRLIQLATSGPLAADATRLAFYADWAPARLLVMTFAITGDFVRCRPQLQRVLQNASLAAADALLDTGKSALGPPPAAAGPGEGEQAASEMRELAALLSRSAATWLIVFSLFAIIA